jgi:hypothetical protein
MIFTRALEPLNLTLIVKNGRYESPAFFWTHSYGSNQSIEQSKKSHVLTDET